MRLVFTLLALTILTTPAFAFQGQDRLTGVSVEIDPGQRLNPGETITVTDYEDNTQHRVRIENVESFVPDELVVEVYDYNQGQYRTFEITRN